MPKETKAKRPRTDSVSPMQDATYQADTSKEHQILHELLPHQSTISKNAVWQRRVTKSSIDTRRVSGNQRATAMAPAKSHRAAKPAAGLSANVISFTSLSPAPGSPFVYKPLDPENIRLLVLHPGRKEEDLVGHLEHRRLLAEGVHQGYSALSYHWGFHPADIVFTLINSREISSGSTLTESPQAQKLLIKPNLNDALLHLRQENIQVYLWVDAICINQQDDEERASQVAKMSLVYSRAANVCIWLGGGVHNGTSQTQYGAEHAEHLRSRIAETFETIRESLKNFDNFNRLTQSSPENTRKWEGVIELLTNKWFSRRWVVQELALAKQATVHYGSETILWSDLSDVIAMIGTQQDAIQRLLLHERSHSAAIALNMRALGASTLVETSKNLFRRNDSGQITQRLITMEGLVSMLLPFEATDPRDTIFAILSIAKDSPFNNTDKPSTASSAARTKTHAVKVDYTASFLDVCSNFMDYCVRKTRCLDIICRPWAPVTTGIPAPQSLIYKLPPDMMPWPSWLPLITKSSFGQLNIQATKQHRRINGESFVGTPFRQGQRKYNASLDRTPDFEFGKFVPTAPYGATSHRTAGAYEPTYNGTLRVKGIIFDKIGEVTPISADGMITHECLLLGGWDSMASLDDSQERRDLPENLWRTMVADRGPDGINAPMWYRRACIECLLHVTGNGHLDTKELLSWEDVAPQVAAFLNRVQSVIWNRRFLRTAGRFKETIYFGLGPAGSAWDDLLCVLYGCCVPVVLRKVRDGKYKLIGETYIYGLMDGEALGSYSYSRGSSCKNAEEVMFTIV